MAVLRWGSRTSPDAGAGREVYFQMRLLQRILIETSLLAITTLLGLVAWYLLALLMAAVTDPAPFTYQDRIGDYMTELRRFIGWPGLLLPYPVLVGFRVWERKRARRMLEGG